MLVHCDTAFAHCAQPNALALSVRVDRTRTRARTGLVKANVGGLDPATPGCNMMLPPSYRPSNVFNSLWPVKDRRDLNAFDGFFSSYQLCLVTRPNGMAPPYLLYMSLVGLHVATIAISALCI